MTNKLIDIPDMSELSPIQILATLGKSARSGLSYIENTSLIDITKPARVEPMCVISKDCLSLDYLPKVTDALLSLFSGYYLQAVSLTAQIGSIKVAKTLDALNPDRSGSLISDVALENNMLVETAYIHRLPTTNNPRAIVDELAIIALESKKGKPQKTSNENTNTKKDEVTKKRNTLNISGNELPTKGGFLGGKILDVTFKMDDAELVIPIWVRISAIPMPTENITNLLAMKVDDDSFIERYHSWRSGKIGFVKDLILAQDLIDKQKRMMMKEKSGVFSETVARANKNKQIGILTKTPSLAISSNLYVISEVVAEDVERKMGGKLSSPRIRNKIFDSTYAMILVVIDREWERVVFYHRGISMSTSMSVKELKASKDNKSDILDIFKAFNSGSAPQF